MQESPPASSGLVDAFRRLGAGVVALVQDRLELIAVEAHEEALRVFQILIWMNAAIFSGMLALTFISFAVVFLFWETARVAVAFSLAGIYLAAFVAIAFYLRHLIETLSKPFAATREEIAKDRACIQENR